MSERESIHGLWTSRWAFILATTGAAVGLGNIWKFPYIAGENGGGAFVLVYLACIALIGVPLLVAEVMIGRRGRQNPAGSMFSAAQDSSSQTQWYWVGFASILAGFLILSYYSVIAGWACDYVFQALLGHFKGKSPQEIDGIFTALVSSPWRLLFWHSMIMLCTVGVIIAGIEHGIERSIRYMFPTMLVLMLIIVLYSVRTGYFGHGLSFLFHPDFHKISANGVLIALGHAFFTLSLATGSIMMYGAYLPRDISIPKTSMFIAAADTFIALIAGLAIFPIVFANGLEPGAGPGLIFKTLPIAFGRMHFGTVFATIFFLMLVFAAFTSAISLLEPTVAWLIERLKTTRTKASILAGSFIWLLGLGSAFSFNLWQNKRLFGLTFFELLDYLTANIMLPLGGLMIAVFAAWFYRRDFILSELNMGNGIVFLTWRGLLGVVAPVAITFVFLHAIGLL